MSPQEFVKAYEMALGAQDWDTVSPLIHINASVVFSNGARHNGKSEIGAAYQRNFDAIKSEEYSMTNLHWLSVTTEMAAYMFDFHWTGVISGKTASGSGRGTAVLKLEGGKWQLIAEHLGPAPPA